MPTSNSGDNQDPDQDTDDPLPDRELATEVQPRHIAEISVPGLGDNLEDSGLIPGFLLLFSLTIPFLIVLLIWTLVVVTEVLFWNWHVYGPPLAILRAITSIINWSPLIGAYFVLRYSANPSFNRLASASIILGGACLFGLLSWSYCALVSPERVGVWYNMTFGQHMQTWSTGIMP